MNETAVKTLPDRSNIAEELTWRLEDIFASDKDWETEYEGIKEDLKHAGQFNGKLSDSAKNLLEGFQYRSKVSERMGKLYTYAHMRSDQDTTNSHYQSLNARAESLYSQVASAFSYFVPEILAMEESTLAQYVQENKGLQLYEQALKEINLSRGHVLSADQEALLAEASEVLGSSGTTFGMLNNADLEFPVIKDENGEDVQISHGNYIRFLESKDRDVGKKHSKKCMKHTVNSVILFPVRLAVQ